MRYWFGYRKESRSWHIEWLRPRGLLEVVIFDVYLTYKMAAQTRVDIVYEGYNRRNDLNVDF